MKTKLLLFSLIALTAISAKNYAQTNWSITGNPNIDPSLNFLGTTNNNPIIFKTNSNERMRLLANGRLGIGIKSADARLNVVSPDNVSLTTPGILMLGDKKDYNLAMDEYTIQARFNGTPYELYLNNFGGTVHAGNSENSGSGLIGNGSGVGLYGISNNNLGMGNYGVYGYTGGGLGGDPNASSGVYGYNASSGYGVGGFCINGSGVYANSVNNIGVIGVGPVYAGFFIGDVFTSGTYLPSDLKLKQNVKDFTSAMDVINKLHPKKYEYRQDGNYKLLNLPKGNHYGLVAEDLEKVLPGLVKQSKFNTRDAQATQAVDPKDGTIKKTAAPNETIDFKAVNYTELIPVMIKGMQEQQSFIEKQQSVIDKQQQQIDELKELIKKIVASNSSDAKAVDVSTGAYLMQNSPNPFSENTIVKYYVPSAIKQAQLVIYDMNGKMIKSYKLSPGINTVNMVAGSLAPGQYNYSLLADGEKVDSKSMVIIK
jgi:hypothetical protein